jgi:hypothetical protein
VEYNQKLKNTVKMVCITIQPEPKEYSKNGMYDRSVKLQQSFMCIMGTLGIGEGSHGLTHRSGHAQDVPRWQIGMPSRWRGCQFIIQQA